MLLLAPAKVNLTLHVTGKRDDGYHLLDSWVVFPGIGDHLRLELADTMSLSIDGPFGPALEGALEGLDDNIILKAAKALDPGRGANINLTKILPIASGIGGGSADAAAALRGLNRLWFAGRSREELKEIGLSLGADVPVCLEGKPVSMSGIGETLTPLPPLPPAYLVLVNPGVAISTPAVFKARTGGFSKAVGFPDGVKTAQDLAEACKLGGNDLADAALTLSPEIGEVLEMLEACPGCLLARMSGSGATCFGLFSEGEDAISAAKAIGNARPRWWAIAAPIENKADNPLEAASGSA